MTEHENIYLKYFLTEELTKEEQEKLNKPLKMENGLDNQDNQFLNMLIKKIEDKEINLLVPSSLINHPVYDDLDDISKGKADVDAFKMLSTIREIYKLWQINEKDSYQMQYLVKKIRIYKEKLEDIGGDIFII